MRRQHTTKMGEAMRMKFSCIISGCPEGARKWHIQIFAMFYIAKRGRDKSHSPKFLNCSAAEAAQKAKKLPQRITVVVTHRCRSLLVLDVVSRGQVQYSADVHENQMQCFPVSVAPTNGRRSTFACFPTEHCSALRDMLSSIRVPGRSYCRQWR